MGNCKSNDAAIIRGYEADDVIEAEEIVRTEIRKEAKKAIRAVLKAEEFQRKLLFRESKVPKPEAPLGVRASERSSGTVSSWRAELFEDASDDSSAMPPAVSGLRGSTSRQEKEAYVECEQSERIKQLRAAVSREHLKVVAAQTQLLDEERRAEKAAQKELLAEVHRVYHREKRKQQIAAADEKRRAEDEAMQQLIRHEEAKRMARQAKKEKAAAEKAANEQKAYEEERERRLRERQHKTRSPLPMPKIVSDAGSQRQFLAAPRGDSVHLVRDERTGRMVWIPPSA